MMDQTHSCQPPPLDGTARTGSLADEERGIDGISHTNTSDSHLDPVAKRRNVVFMALLGIAMCVGVLCAVALTRSPREGTTSVVVATADDGVIAAPPTTSNVPPASSPPRVNDDEASSGTLGAGILLQASGPTASPVAAASGEEVAHSIFYARLENPTDMPTAHQHSAHPSSGPTSTSSPSIKESDEPSTSLRPTTPKPTLEPSIEPTSTSSPSIGPSDQPSASTEPTTPKPTREPTGAPTSSPSNEPTFSPFATPTRSPFSLSGWTFAAFNPTDRPTYEPTTKRPTNRPTTSSPSRRPTEKPSTSSPTPSPSKKPTESPSSTPTVYDAVVVGAGWGGIRAAQVLSDSGHTVLVIEANDYVGGRSRTVALDALPGVPTDLGSEWLYEDSDMESELVKRGLVDAAIANDASKTLPYWNVRYYSQSTNKNDAVVAAPLENEDEFSELWGEFVSFVQGLGDVSYADALEQFIKKNNVNGNDEEQYLNLVLDSGELEYAGDTNSMSVSDQPFYFMNEECGSDSLYMSVPGVGFGSTAESFANDLNVEIKLKSKVVGIDYEDRDGGVIISFEENGTTKEVMTRTAVVTVSLGVLQAGTIAFSPNLPDDKQDAIDNMGFGLLNKCVLYWNNEEDMVWPGDYYWFRLVTPEDESSGLFTSFFSPQKLKGIPSLIGWVGGDEAVAMEEQTDDEIMDRVMANLRSMFPTIKDPDEVIITRWAQEENFRGSYSFGKSDRSFQDDASNLKERVGNVWFAGEATNLAGWQATTVGAWDTGEEAAQDMASFLKG